MVSCASSDACVNNELVRACVLSVPLCGTPRLLTRPFPDPHPISLPTGLTILHNYQNGCCPPLIFLHGFAGQQLVIFRTKSEGIIILKPPILKWLS